MSSPPAVNDFNPGPAEPEGGTLPVSGNESVDDNPSISLNSQTVSSETTMTKPLPPSDPTSIRNTIGNYITTMYGWGSFDQAARGQAAAGGAPAQPTSAPHAATPASALAPVAAGSEASPHTAINPGPGQEAPQVILDWTVRIRFNKYGLGQSFGVLIFLGDVPDDAEQWISSPNFVGTHAAYVSNVTSQPDQYDNYAQMEGISVGCAPLNASMAKLSGLSSFDPNVVTPYLKANLNWRVQTVRSFCDQSFV